MGNRRETKSTHKRKKVDGTKRMLVVAAAAALVIVAVFGVWELGRHNRKWGAPDELRAIKSERLAQESIPGLAEVNKRVDGTGSFVTKVVSPRVLRTFDTELLSQSAAMQEAVDLAKQDGWVHDPTLETGDEWWGRQESRGFNLTTIIRPDPGNQRQINVEVF